MESFYFTWRTWAYCLRLHQQKSVQVWSEPSPGLPIPHSFPNCQFWIGWMSELVVCADFLVYMALQKASISVQIRPTIWISAQLQRPMFRACCPVSILGGVIHPSAPRWHERFMFILDQSACLFIKGFDHSTPRPPGSNYPPAALIRFTLSPGQFRNILSLFFFCLSFFSELFLQLFFPFFSFSLALWRSISVLSHFAA